LKKYSSGDIAFNIINYSLMIMLSVITLYPFLNVLAISFNNSVDTVKGGISIYPREFTLDNYIQIFKTDALATSVLISVLRTVIGTATGIISAGMVAFTISRRDFFAQRVITVLYLVTMYVSGGLIPEYMLIRNLHLTNSFLVYILPGLISVFNVIVIRAFIDGLPFELQESAKLDGANDFVIFYKIVFPLCMPAIATISLFIAVGQWNSWFDTYLYNGSNKNLTTLQFELQKILLSAQSSGRQDIYGSADMVAQKRVSPESIRMAMTIVATVPILIVYPFVQKYFMKGLTLGAVKS
jgi:putative aldouronate transport system permease protein